VKVPFFLHPLVFIFIMYSLVTYASDDIKLKTDPEQRIDVHYRLFKTENMWNFLELDTQTGRVWQVQYSVNQDINQSKVLINSMPLASNGKNGRFTLYPTNNIWNFILVDQDDGRVWQAQFSLNKENRALIPIPHIQ